MISRKVGLADILLPDGFANLMYQFFVLGLSQTYDTGKVSLISLHTVSVLTP